MKPGFVILRGNRLQDLGQLVIETIQRNPLAPFETERFIVQSNGMADWLKHRLVAHQGISMGEAFERPARFQWEMYRAYLGDLPAETPFDKTPLAWHLVECWPEYEALLRDAGVSAQAHSLLETLSLCETLADLFDQYQLYRMDWLDAWAKGAVPETHPWQGKLWQHLTQALGSEHRGTIHQRFMQAAAPQDALPQRVIVFGVSTLPPGFLDCLGKLANHCQVIVALQLPTPAFWGDQTRYAHNNSLLAGWGAQGRDFASLLMDYGAQETWPGIEVDVFQEPEGQTALGALQQSLYRVEPIRPNLEPDKTLHIARCHSPLRELQVLKDQLLAAFEDDPTLVPGDVLVLVPNLDEYAGLINSVMGSAPKIPFAAGHDGPEDNTGWSAALRYFFGCLTRPASLADWIKLLSFPAVRALTQLSPQSLESLESALTNAGGRFGLNGVQQNALGEPNVARYGLRETLDRLIVGDWAGPVPVLESFGLPDLSGQKAEDLFVLDRWVSQCEAVFSRLSDGVTPTEFVTLLRHDLMTLVPPETELDWRHFASLEASVDALPSEIELDLDTVSALVERAFGDHRLAQQFITGRVNFVSLMPMRAVPFKRIAVLGLQDGQFPRAVQPNSWDLMTQAPRVGDRSRVEDDRYLMLETLLSAQERIHLSYVGFDPLSGEPVTPSPLLTQLLDALPPGEWTTTYPMQPFSPQYYGDSSSFKTYDATWDGWGKAVDVEPRSQALASSPTHPFEYLMDFVASPPKAFLTHQLGIYSPFFDSRDRSAESLGLEPLDRARLLKKATRSNLAMGEATARGQLGGGVFAEVDQRQMASLLSRWTACLDEDPASLVVSTQTAQISVGETETLTHQHELHGGWLVGVVNATGDKISLEQHVKHLRLYVEHCLLSAAGVGFKGTWALAMDGFMHWPAMDSVTANARLNELWGLAARHFSDPLPITRNASLVLLGPKKSEVSFGEALIEAVQTHCLVATAGDSWATQILWGDLGQGLSGHAEEFEQLAHTIYEPYWAHYNSGEIYGHS